MREKMQRFIKAFQMNGQVKKRTILYGVIALAVIAAVILLACLSPKEDDAEAPDDEASVKEQTAEPTEIVEPEGMKETFEKYPDVYAWLEIPGTAEVLNTSADVSYPVAQHPTEREFYLNHDLDGNKYKPGTLYTEAQVEDQKANGKDLEDPVTIIYGHNQADRTMFGGLQTYASQLDFSKQNVMYLYQENRRVTYQIVGGVQYDTSHILYYHQFEFDQVFNLFFETLWAEQDSTTHVDADNMPVAGDKVLILSVCKNGDDQHRYLIIGKMIEDTADPTVAEKAE